MLGGTELYERLMRRGLMMLGARPRWVPIEGGAVHALEIVGEGPLPPVALMHGFSASGASQYWSMVPALRRRVSRIIIPDLPGHGMSSVPIGFSGDHLHEGVVSSLRQLLPEPTVIFASSLAGGLAVRFAGECPDRIRGLMLCSPGGAPLINGEREHLVRMFDIRAHADALSFVDRLFPRPHPMRHMYAWGVRQQFNRPHLAGLLDRIGSRGFLRPGELQRLPMPVHLIWGRADRVLPETHYTFFERNLPKTATIERPHNFGHAPFLHRGAELADRLLAFCERV
jgi:pyruvate dehydrogenase E2 component (dihydrolipoamide acetyltransferase)